MKNDTINVKIIDNIDNNIKLNNILKLNNNHKREIKN